MPEITDPFVQTNLAFIAAYQRFFDKWFWSTSLPNETEQEWLKRIVLADRKAKQKQE